MVMTTTNTGTGADTLTFAGLSGLGANLNVQGTPAADTITTGYHMDDSELITGAGAETLTITAGASDVAEYANIDTGDGADTITIGIILKLSIFDTGAVGSADGADTVTLKGGLYTDIDTGTGADTVTIGSLVGGIAKKKGRDYAEDYGSIDTGADSDTLTVLTVSGSKVQAGSGNNTVTMTTVDDSEFFSGGGNDTVSMTSVNDSNLSSGDGNDTVHIYGTMIDSTLNTGNGNNTVTIGNARGALFDENSELTSITTGEDSDSVIITKMGGYVNVSTGAGTDTLNLALVEDGYSGTVDLGSGNDTLTMTLANANALSFLVDEGSEESPSYGFDGGGGFDTLTLAGVTAADWNDGLWMHFTNFETVNVAGISVNPNGPPTTSTSPPAPVLGTDPNNLVIITDTGAGADTLTFTGHSTTANINGTAAADIIDGNYRMDNSILKTGAGADTLTVIAVSGSVAIDANIYTEAGADRINVDYTLQDSIFDTGAGADIASLAGITGSTLVTTGAGADILTIDSVANYVGSVDLGVGADILTMHWSASNYSGASFDGGIGADILNLTGVTDWSAISGQFSNFETINLL